MEKLDETRDKSGAESICAEFDRNTNGAPDQAPGQHGTPPGVIEQSHIASSRVASDDFDSWNPGDYLGSVA